MVCSGMSGPGEARMGLRLICCDTGLEMVVRLKSDSEKELKPDASVKRCPIKSDMSDGNSMSRDWISP
jgi:hypothetical protein